MNYIIFDLEATCWEGESKNHVQEIIEIGAVKIDARGDVESRFTSFVRPKLYPILSDFCKRLTSISQIDVNRAAKFPEVVEEFKEWIGYYDDEDYLLCSWGFFDQIALARDCKLHHLEYDWTESHISLKHQYQTILGLKKPIGLKSAVEKEGYEFTGTHHRGIDDAENLAKIFLLYQGLWQF